MPRIKNKTTKTLLFLGGSHFQLPAIQAAKKMGHRIVTCDFLPQNPGHRLADEYHNVSTTDKDGVLDLATRLGVDGIVCYASDPAAPTAAYVTGKLGLPGQPFASVEILCDKALFRAFLEKNGFNTPHTEGFPSPEAALEKRHRFTLPVMIKPADSSGSKGVAKIIAWDELPRRAAAALERSKSKRFVIEEYIEKCGYQIGGDGFSVDGKLVFRCFTNAHFDLSGANPFAPIGGSWPSAAPVRVQEKAHREFQRALTLLGMKTGAYNFEAFVDRAENIWIMEIAPRNGGNMLPQAIRLATGVDLADYTIRAALGESCDGLKMVQPGNFGSYYVIHAHQPGIFKALEISPDFRRDNVVSFDVFIPRGSRVSAFTGSNATLGIMMLKYETQTEMLEKTNDMDRYVQVITEKE